MSVKRQDCILLVRATGILMLSLLFLSALFPCFAGNRWDDNGILLLDEENSASAQAEVVPDGEGGAIMVWVDNRHDPEENNLWIYAQKVDSNGNTLWERNGVPVAGVDQIDWPRAVADGSGGAVIAWEDAREWPKLQVFAQRINADGEVMWQENGATICDRSGFGIDQGARPDLVSTGDGGAMVFWNDYRRDEGDDESDIYAQRVDANGTMMWTENGIRISPLPESHTMPKVCTDGSGGAIAAFYGPALSWIAQRVDGQGNLLWPEEGVSILKPLTESSLTQDSTIVTDEEGGALLVWSEDRSYPFQCYDVYAQRVDHQGSVLWQEEGVPVMVTDRDDPSIPEATAVADGSGGGIVTWVDMREGEHLKLYAQRLYDSGDPAWTVNGIVVSEGDTDKAFPGITTDGLGGAIINWMDGLFEVALNSEQKIFDGHRKISANADPWNIFLQRVDHSGLLKWGDEGVRPSDIPIMYDICPIGFDGAGGAIVSWSDIRNNEYRQGYAQRISNPPPEVNSVSPSSSVATGTVEVRLEGSFFYPEATVRLVKSGEPEISGTLVAFDSEEVLTCEFDLTGAALGNWDVVVINPDMQSGMIADGFQVTMPKTWYLAEGSTGFDDRGSFETWVLLQNPGEEAANVSIFYQTPTGETEGPKMTLEPRTRQTVNVAETVPETWSVSTRVESDVPMIAERAMYWHSAQGIYRQAAHDSIGLGF